VRRFLVPAKRGKNLRISLSQTAFAPLHLPYEAVIVERQSDTYGKLLDGHAVWNHILASLALTMIASLCIAASITLRTRAKDAPDDGITLAASLIGYALIMLFVTYGAIVVYYLAGSIMGMFSVYQTLGATLGTQLWRVMQFVVVCG
jgi:hypothetical protein